LKAEIKFEVEKLVTENYVFKIEILRLKINKQLVENKVTAEENITGLENFSASTTLHCGRDTLRFYFLKTLRQELA